MAQDNIVELLVGRNGDIVTGDIFVDYTTNTISGPGLKVSILNQLVNLQALTLQQNQNGTYTIFGASLAIGAIPASSVVLTLGSTNPVSLTATTTIAGITNTATEVVVGAPVTCFASGTLITTVRGDIAVEDLRVGDHVVTSGGALRSIRWLGHRTMNCRAHPRPHEAMPVCISSHAFGAGLPSRDLYLSPGHSICVALPGEVLVPASALINGSTVRQIEVDTITYWHVELDSHDIILANGLPSETFLEMGNRTFFAEGDVVSLDAAPDANGAHRTHADFCRPYHEHGPLVETVRAQMRDHAAALGWQLSHDTDFWLEVDGRRIDAFVLGGTARFQLPAGARDVWLVSPTARPCDAAATRDVRELGLQIASMRIEDGMAAPRDVAIDDTLLCVGFYGVEDDRFRWTAGRALLPTSLWQGRGHGSYLRMTFAGAPIARWQRPVEARPALALVG